MKISHFVDVIFLGGILLLILAASFFRVALGSPNVVESRTLFDQEVPVRSDSIVGSVAIPFNVNEKGEVYASVDVALTGQWFDVHSEHFAVSPNGYPVEFADFAPGKYYLVVPFVLYLGLEYNYSLAVNIHETVRSSNPLLQYAIVFSVVGAGLVAVSGLMFLPHKRLIAAVLLVVLVSASGILAYRYVLSQPLTKSYPTVHIRADGSVEGTDKIASTDSNTYTLTGNLNASLVVEKDDIVVDGANHTIQGLGNWTGIDLQGVSQVTVRNFRIMNYETGIYLMNSSYITIAGNEITNCTHGIKMHEFSRDSTVIGNSITNGQFIVGMRATNGIEFWYASNNSILDNRISDNYNGVFLDWFSENDSIVENDIAANSDGIVAGIAQSNFIYHNNFLNNSYRQVIYYGPAATANTWDNGYPSGGNYWSDYNGTDADGDGIGDTPYVIDTESYPVKVDNIDRYPLMNPRF